MSEEQPKEANADEEELSFEKALKYRKNSSYLAAILLVIVSVLKIASLGEGHKLQALIMCFYFLGIGLVIVGVEYEVGAFQQWFLFLNFGWGKTYLYSFLFFCILSQEKISLGEWIIAGAFLAAAFFNTYLHMKYKHLEMDRVRQAIEKIQAKFPDAKADPDAEKENQAGQ